MIKATKQVFICFLLKHKILFFILFVIQIVSIFASMFTLSYYTSSIEIYKEFEASKTFTANLEDSIEAQELEGYITKFQKDINLPIKEISVRSDNENNYLMFDYLYCPSHYKFGRYFSENEFKNKEHLIITSKNVFPNALVGDTVELSGINFSVIGTNDYIEYNILPFSFINDIKHINSKVVVTFNDYLDVNNSNQVIRLMKKHFKSNDINAPDRDNENIFSDYTVLIYIGIFTLSVINIACVYRYILECNKQFAYIFRLNGATKIQCLLIFTFIIIIFGFFSLAVGCFFSALLLPEIIRLIDFDTLRYNLEFKHYFIMFITYLSIIILVFLPFISKCIKKVSISNFNGRFLR